jgi:hypothetical protein
MADPDNMTDKVVIDTTNPLDFSQGLPPRMAVGICHLNDKEGEKVPFDFLRFTEVSEKIEASDHCPVFQDLVLE